MGWRQAAGLCPAAQDHWATRLGHRDRGSTLRLYLDTSALVKLFVEEPGAVVVREAVAEARQVVTSVLAYVEARAAFSRKRHEGGLRPGAHRRVIRRFDEEWKQLVRVAVTGRLLKTAARLAERHRLRAYDAVHLASATVADEAAGNRLVFASWDHPLEAAAIREGFLPLRR